MQMASHRDYRLPSPQYVQRENSTERFPLLPQYPDNFHNTSNHGNEAPLINPLVDNFVRPPNSYIMNGGEIPYNVSTPNLHYIRQPVPAGYPVVDNRSETAIEPKKKVSYPFPKPNYQTHRRVRSGDSAIWEANRQNSPTARHGFASPQSTNPRISNVNIRNIPPPVSINLSESYNNMIPQYRGHSPNDLYSNSPITRPLHVHIPEEQEEKHDHKQQHYLKQVNSFMKLNQAIENSERLKEQLEGQVRKMEDELNSRSAVEKNPTEKDFSRLKDENEYLMKEIRDMQSELDSYNIPYPGDPISQDVNKTSSPPYTRPVNLPFDTSGPDNMLAKPPTCNSSNNSHVSITTQPTSITRPVSGISYENVILFNQRSQDPTVYVPNSYDTPPSVPPRIPTNPEKWRCPKCTFDNLILSYCEMCGEFRPTNLNMIKSS